MELKFPMNDQEFEQPCGCVVVKRWRGKRHPLWYIKGQEDGISENPLGMPSGCPDEKMVERVVQEFCPHKR
jgi:hypothetical protein